MRYDFTIINQSGKLMEIGSNESNYIDALIDLSKVMYHYGFDVSNLKPFYYFTNKLGKISRRRISIDKLTFIDFQISQLKLTFGE